MNIAIVLRSCKLLIFLIFFINFPILGKVDFKKNIDEIKNEKNIEEIKDKSYEEEFIKLTNISQIKKLLINNNEELKVIKSQIEQAKRNLKAKYSAWYPRLSLNSDQLPKYTTGDIRGHPTSCMNVFAVDKKPFAMIILTCSLTN